MLFHQPYTLPAISYLYHPELRKNVMAWEYRNLALVVGVILLYLVLRPHFYGRTSAVPFRRRALQVFGRVMLFLAIGLLPVWLLWSCLDPMADQYTLIEVWRAATPGQLTLCVTGWFTWSILAGEVFLAVQRVLQSEAG